MRLTIFQKGLLLVSVPLAFEIAFVAYLSSLLHAADAELVREQHAKDVILHADKLRRNWTEAAFADTLYAFNQDPVLLAKYESVVNEINDDMIALRKLCASNASQMRVLESLDETNIYTARLLEAIQHEPNPLMALFPGKSVARGTHPFMVLRRLCDRIIAQEQAVLDQIPAIRQENRTHIHQALWGAIGFNVVLTIFFTAYLSRNITGRLRSVMANTHNMVNREKLLPEVGGTDEIAELDRSIHRTAHELNELETFKRELTAMVTHELRSPLTSIQGVLTLLRIGALGELPELARNKVQMAEANSQRLIRLINDLLDIEKMEAGKLQMTIQATSLQAIVDQSIGAVQDFATQNEVSIENAPVDAWVEADAERIVQVIINFLSNAIKYSNKGGIVTVTTSVEKQVEVRVTDTGRGIPDEFREKIFDKFQQVDMNDARDRRGTGLGLSISKAIVEQHGGLIGVESEVGKGSSFWFTINIAEKPSQEAVSGGEPEKVSRS